MDEDKEGDVREVVEKRQLLHTNVCKVLHDIVLVRLRDAPSLELQPNVLHLDHTLSVRVDARVSEVEREGEKNKDKGLLTVRLLSMQ